MYHITFKIVSVFILFTSFRTYAVNSNSLNFCDSFFKVYVNGCDNRASSNVSGGSFPLLFDALNLGPANLPTYLTPTGIEYFQGKSESNFALIKGFKKIGLGALSRATKNTFMSEVENYEIALKNRLQSYNSTLTDSFKNLGLAFDLLTIPNMITIPVGFSYKYNPLKKVGSIVYGISARTPYLNVSYSYNKEEPKTYNNSYYNLTEIITTQKGSIGVKYRTLIADYMVSRINHNSLYSATGNYSYYNTSGKYDVTTSIASATYQLGDINFTFAHRTQEDSRFKTQQSYLDSIGYRKTHQMYGIRYTVNQYINLGVYHNYVIDEDISLLLQILM